MNTYHITCGTYGTRLHGGFRPTVDKEHNQYGTPFIYADANRENDEMRKMNEEPCYFSDEQRAFVQDTVTQLCQRGGWLLHNCACEVDHMHVLLSAEAESKKVRLWLKTWLSQALNERYGKRQWFAKCGSRKVIYERERDYFDNAMQYIENQRYNR